MRFRGSYFASKAESFSNWFYDSMKNGAIGTLLSKYESEKELAENSIFFSIISKYLSKIKLKKTKLRFLIFIDRIRKLFGIDAFLKGLLRAKLRTYSIGIMSFVMYSSVAYYLKISLGRCSYELSYTIRLGSLLFLSIILFFSGKPLSDVIIQSRSANFILFSILGLRKSTFKTKHIQKRERLGVAFFIGMAGGVISYFVSIDILVLGLILILLAYSVLVSPEIGIILLCLSLPFASEKILFGILMATLFAYTLKLFSGKRNLKLELFDISVLISSALMFFAGLFSVDKSVSLPRSLTMISMMMGYILIVNLVKNKAWIHRCVSSLLCSSSIVGIYGIIQLIFKSSNINSLFETDITFTEITSFFDSPFVLAQYLAISFILFISALSVNGKKIRRAFIILMCGGFLLLIFTINSVAVWLSLLIAIIIFCMIISRRTLIVLLCSIPVVPILPFILSDNVTSVFEEVFSSNTAAVSYRASLLDSSLMMIKEHFFGGCGIGGFSLIYPSYAIEGIETAANSSNLYFEIIISMGIFGLLAFFSIIFLFLQSNFSFYNNYFSIPNTLPASGVATIVFLLSIGLGEYPWMNTHLFLLFWVVLGISTAARRYVTNSVPTADLL